MSGWIAFGCFLLLGITDAVFAWKLNGEPWAFLMAGDPKLPDGEYVYVPSRFQQAAKLLCLFYAVVFFLSALAALLTQALRVLPLHRPVPRGIEVYADVDAQSLL